MNDQQQRALAAGLRALADRTRDAEASAHVEQAILAELARRHARGQSQPASVNRPASPDRLQPVYRFAAVAAGLLLAVAAALWMVRVDRPSRPATVQPAGFVAVPQAAALPEMESASIVRVSLPVSSLPVYGVAIVPEVTTDSVQAELLVAQDGQPRAIRLVNISRDARSMSND